MVNTGNTVLVAFSTTYSCTVFIMTLPAGAKDSSVLLNVQSISEAHTACYAMVTRVLSRG
jgi:hypothetical protein